MVCAGEEGQEGLYRDAPREGAGCWSLRSPRASAPWRWPVATSLESVPALDCAHPV